MNSESGVIRIKNGEWVKLTKLAVKVSGIIKIPVNQATVLHSIMHKRLDGVSVEEATEMVTAYLELGE